MDFDMGSPLGARMDSDMGRARENVPFASLGEEIEEGKEGKYIKKG